MEDFEDIERKSEQLISSLDEHQRSCRIIRKAEEDAKYQFFKTLFLKQYVSEFMTDGKVPNEAQLTSEQKSVVVRASLRNMSKPPFIWFTMNPRFDVPFEKIKKLAESFVKKKAVTKYFYTFEVISEEHRHIHMHIVIEYACRPWDMLRAIKRHFVEVTNVNNTEILHIDYIREELIEQKINYMLGDKEEDKLPDVVHTREWRILNNLPPYYESSPTFPCRATPLLASKNID